MRMRTELKKFRIGKHLTQAQFAKKIGVSRATYSFVERGERSGGGLFWSSVQCVFSVPDEEMWKLQKLDEESVDEQCEANDEK